MVSPPVLPVINSRTNNYNKNHPKPTFIVPQCNLITQSNGELNNNNNNNTNIPSFQIDNNSILNVPQETNNLLGSSLNANPQNFQTSQPRSISVSHNHSPSRDTRHVNTGATNNQSQPNQKHQLNNELYLSFSLIENDIKEIRDYLRHTRKKLENTDSKSKQTNDWKQVALVLDRGLFFLYIIAIIVSIAIMFNSYS